tara:strand:+ start:253 stop:471 length:219 start_codon:yes stop_codon:yes gene_type:complete
MQETIYHIYAKDKCLYNSLNEEEFKKTWSTLQSMIGLLQSDYSLEDLSYEKLPPGTDGYKTSWTEPAGEDSY